MTMESGKPLSESYGKPSIVVNLLFPYFFHDKISDVKK